MPVRVEARRKSYCQRVLVLSLASTYYSYGTTTIVYELLYAVIHGNIYKKLPSIITSRVEVWYTTILVTYRHRIHYGTSVV